MNVFRRLVYLFIVLQVISAAYAQEPPMRYIAITFDDLPAVCRCPGENDRLELTDKLLATYRKYDIPVMAVVNEDKLEVNGTVDQSRISLLQKWLAAGIELGNHGYSHKDINEITSEEYKQEIFKGERITRGLSEKAGKPYRFFRHPYLSAGDNLKVRKDLDIFLKDHKYIIAPNTITYQDYTFSGAYETALQKGDTELAGRIREAYLVYTLSQWEAAERQSTDLFGRDIRHILMVHANRLNADAFGDVVKMMRNRGYVFISIDEALKDPVYSRPDTYDGKVGSTWLSRWAAEMGKSGINYGRASVPRFVLDVRR